MAEVFRHVPGTARRGTDTATRADVAESAPAQMTAQAMAARAAVTISLLAGVWVALSPWLLTLQQGGGSRVAVHEVIVGLVAAAVALTRLSRPTSTLEFDLVGAALGIWLIISPFLLAISMSVNAGLYWSSIWSGGVILVMSLIALATGSRRT